MRSELVEIYSDASNFAVMRHPGRRFPGMLVQGDSLHTLVTKADRLCAALEPGSEASEHARELRDNLRARLDHYKKVLGEHGIPLPFVE
jgi:hypothetical protein